MEGRELDNKPPHQQKTLFGEARTARREPYLSLTDEDRRGERFQDYYAEIELLWTISSAVC